MKPEDRRHDIIELLVDVGSATLEDLAQRFGVSRMTVHRDLDELEEEGLLRKVRGGATIEASGQFESDFRYRARLATDEKRLIAERAAMFLTPGTSIIIDDGSTSQMLMPHLLDKRPLTVITNNQAVIETAAQVSGIDLIALGGTYSRKFNGFFGVLTLQALSNLRVDMAFLSTSAIQGTSAFHQDQEVLEVKRRMISSAARKYLMVDHRKFGRPALHYMTDLDVFDGIVTTRDLDPRTASDLRAQGVEVHFPEESET
ncbi:transcriptional regulator, DeoR family [Jannaschia faecimaris]|uniref:Transcriptional regulator, DeoR family n=1 Tax=Jannaschia faecimaris TaxID=1244108 RepID=A0A1H3P4J2_9RHOB|nr:DeoR/GlpR family DNA-binding transcription regulator [Jannaschia faecimaris]SDY96074.1 transcriptional regulator, DeoR family [Jannaschia faecimaris]